MRKLSKIKLIVSILISLLFISLMIPKGHMIVGSDLGAIFLMIMIYGWYLSVIKTIKENIGINTFHEMLIKSCLVIVPLLSVINLWDNIVLTNLAGSPINNTLFIGAILFNFIAFYLLASNFQLFLNAKKTPKELFIIFLQLIIFPLGIWVYQDKLKEWRSDFIRNGIRLQQ